jgi:hypothetical protein
MGFGSEEVFQNGIPHDQAKVKAKVEVAMGHRP